MGRCQEKSDPLCMAAGCFGANVRMCTRRYETRRPKKNKIDAKAKTDERWSRKIRVARCAFLSSLCVRVKRCAWELLGSCCTGLRPRIDFISGVV